MKTSASTIVTEPAAGGAADEPAVWTLTLIFWLAFAGAAAVTAFLNPQMFGRHDPDSFMRLVQVRDLMNGQGWFDLVQHRLDPPDGVLMHWSRLIDAPLAALIMVGDVFAAGERLALTVWPLLMLLALMSANVGVATALAGRAAAVPVLILSLLFFSPLLTYLPNDIDHHNAQLALLAATLAAVMRAPSQPLYGLAAGLGCALMLAIGLEMLPYVALIGVIVALRWAMTGDGEGGAALFGAAFAVAPAALYEVSGSQAAGMACDSLSWAYALPAAVAGAGLAAAAIALRASSQLKRLATLGALGAGIAAIFVLRSPDCLSGPYGQLAPELKALWLSSVSEAQPLLRFFTREPVGTVATFGPPTVALVVALQQIYASGQGMRSAWLAPTAVVAIALAMSFYQVRTLPVANGIAIPLLGAWLAGIAARHGIVSLRPLRRAMPLVAAFLVAMPLVHLAVGWVAVRAVEAATGGRIAPIARPEAPKDRVADLSTAEQDCNDPASAALLASVPQGLVLAPVFYGASVLMLSPHAAVAAPYHRGGAAILDTIRAFGLPPERARPIVAAHHADYVVLCATSRESAADLAESDDSLLTQLLEGRTVPWLEPVPAERGSELRLWRVLPGAP